MPDLLLLIKAVGIGPCYLGSTVFALLSHTKLNISIPQLWYITALFRDKIVRNRTKFRIIHVKKYTGLKKHTTAGACSAD